MTGSRHRQRGFTLIELLLVAAIIGVMAAITVPNFVRSMRSNRLRSAARTVVMMGRYARSMALLKQQEMVIRFDIDAATLSLHPVRTSYLSARATSDTERLLYGGADKEADAEKVGEHDDKQARLSAGLEAEEMARSFDLVSIDFVELEESDERVSDGYCVVMYRSNGTCTPYKVRIMDDQGEAILIKVDMLSSAETERD